MDYPSSLLYIPHPRRFYSLIKAYRGKPSIDPPTVREILNYYDLELIGPLKPISAGMRNESLAVNTSEGLKFLKRYKESLGETTIIQEHSILKHLAEKEFPAVRLIPAKLGQTLIHFKEHRYAFFEYINGFRVYDYIFLPTTRQQFIASAGKLLGSLHRVLNYFAPDGFNPDGFNPQTNRRWRDTEWFLNKIDDIRIRSSDKKFTRMKELSIFIGESQNLGDSLVEIQKQLRPVNLPRQIIHKDFGPSNILFRKNEKPIVIDFEIARLDWRVVDLINGWEKFCNSKFGFSQKKMKIFLDAYQKEVRLSENEFKYIPLVWKYLNLTACIFSFHQFCLTGSRPLLAYACRSFKKANWKAGDYNFVKTIIHSNDFISPS